MDFNATKAFMMKKLVNIKNIYRNESKKGIYTTVIMRRVNNNTNTNVSGTVRLMDGDEDDYEKAILWAYLKALNVVVSHNKLCKLTPINSTQDDGKSMSKSKQSCKDHFLKSFYRFE